MSKRWSGLRKSWAWSFSASVLTSAIDLIQPVTPGEPVELEATINGTAYRLLAERGHKPARIEKILGLNFVCYAREVWGG